MQDLYHQPYEPRFAIQSLFGVALVFNSSASPTSTSPPYFQGLGMCRVNFPRDGWKDCLFCDLREAWGLVPSVLELMKDEHKP